MSMRTAFALAFLPSLAVADSAPDPVTAYNNHCRTCHSRKEGDHRLGPSLHGIVGRMAGTAPGYAFSGTLASTGFIWDVGTLDTFIEAPDRMVRGNMMKPYGGISDPVIRRAIIEALEAVSP